MHASPTPIIEWLLDPESRELTLPQLIEQLGERLNAAGLSLLRVTTSIHTLHPEVFVRTVRWFRGRPVESMRVPHSIQQSPDYIGSPVQEIYEGAAEIRHRLEGASFPLRYAQLGSLLSLGATDYCAHAIALGRGRKTFMAYVTDRPGGFTEAELDLLRQLRPALSMRLSLASAEYATSSLLRVYLGKEASRRVLSGSFRRGTGQEIDAAIFFCDMRGFTALTDSRPMTEVIEILNQYFEALAAPIASNGGEILKFIGDAVLAIFRVDDLGPAKACANALLAAEQAQRAISALRATSGIDAGIGLHLGRVMYGNIGAQDRLDFTVIGPAVNEASRIEALSKELAEPIILSGELARHLPADRVRSLGARSLRGVRAPKELFAPSGAS